MMRQDRFTEQALEVIQASQEMVRQYRHQQWDVEHVFLAALSHKDGLARRIFEKLDVPVEDSGPARRDIKEEQLALVVRGAHQNE